MNWLYYALAIGLPVLSLVGWIWLRRWMVMRTKAADALYRLVGYPMPEWPIDDQTMEVPNNTDWENVQEPIIK